MAQRNAGVPEPFPAARGGPLDDGRQREAAVTIARPALTKVSADSAESPQKIPLFQFPRLFLGMLGIAGFHGALACLIFRVSAQNRSGLVEPLAMSISPSAATISDWSRLAAATRS